MPSPEKKKIAVFISGRGSNLKALIDACAIKDFPAEIALVVSNSESAAGLELAKNANIPTFALDHKPFGKDREAHEKIIHEQLLAADIDYICLAGYMRLLSPFLIQNWNGRMLNIHPSLLPAFPGLDTHQRALATGVRIHGCTVHIVTETMDEGPILGQAAVPVLPHDSEEELARRVLTQEHFLYPQVLKHYILRQKPTPSIFALLNG